VPDLEQEIRQRAAQIESKLIAWRRDIHEHPELGEQETRAALSSRRIVSKAQSPRCRRMRTGFGVSGQMMAWLSKLGGCARVILFIGC
jgi:amidohydrolase